MTGTTSGAPALGYIVHPTDFTALGEAAFAHALRLALAVKGHLCVVHAEHVRPDDDPDWSAFPGVRATLGRWGVLPPDAPASAIKERLGLRVVKAIAPEADPAQALEHFFTENRCDLLVLATHAREGFARLLHGSIAEALARQVDGPSLLLPLGGRIRRRCHGDAAAREHPRPGRPRHPPKDAVSLALRMADALGCGDALAHTLHVGAPEEAPIVAVDAQHEPRLRRLTGEGEVVAAILDAATRVDAA